VLADIWGAVGGIASVAAAIAAVVAILYARATVKDSKQARIEADRDRRLRTLLHVSELNERLFWEAGRGDDQWRDARNRLRIALAGASDPLPNSQAAAEAANRDVAMGAAKEARVEIQSAVERLLSEPN
jgi:hypothetical protein